MIAVDHIQMRLTAGGQVVTILDDVTFDIPDKQVVAVVGPSGSGKSTLLGLMAGIDRPTTGSIVVDGVEITALPEHAMARFRREKIGYIFQSFHLIPTLTALENVAIPLELSGDPRALDQAADLLATVGLPERQAHYPVQLSGGEQQRVAVARAFACRPPILLADEPTGNLDTATGQQIIELLLSLNRDHGSTLVLVTHDPSLSAYAERVIALRDGRIESDSLNGSHPGRS
jgi:putative ABC transport system ATP-binding protein